MKAAPAERVATMAATAVAAAVQLSTGTPHRGLGGLQAASITLIPNTCWKAHANGAPSSPNHIKKDRRRFTATERAG